MLFLYLGRSAQGAILTVRDCLGSVGSHCGQGATAGLQFLGLLPHPPSAPQKPGPSVCLTS